MRRISAADPFYRWLTTWHWVPLVVFGLAVLALGGWPMVLWLVFFRVTVGLHSTWLVNSATHMWGRRRFQTKDDSKNSWWVAILTFGEGWHNNHHAHPTSARHGLAWYEVDITWLQIKALELLGDRRSRPRRRRRRPPARSSPPRGVTFRPSSFVPRPSSM